MSTRAGAVDDEFTVSLTVLLPVSTASLTVLLPGSTPLAHPTST
jgi:hypothetical protein